MTKEGKAFGMGAIALAVCLAFSLVGRTLFGGEISAWVQAFGSIAAIGVAIWLSQRDKAHAKQREAAKDVERFRRVQALIATCDSVLADASLAVRAPSPDRSTLKDFIEKFRLLDGMVRSIDLHDLPDAVVGGLILDLLIGLQQAIGLLDHDAVRIPVHQGIAAARDEIANRLERSQSVATRIHGILQAAVDGARPHA